MVLKAGLIFLMQYEIRFLGEMEPAHPDRFCEIHSTYYISFAWQHLNTSDDQDLTIRMEWSQWHHNIHPKWTASLFNVSFYDKYGPVRTISTDITDPDSQQSHRNSKSMSKHILKIEIFPNNNMSVHSKYLRKWQVYHYMLIKTEHFKWRPA